jgi:hypothetical protein
MSRSHTQDGGIEKQGFLHEESALKMIGGNAENLNHNPKLDGMNLPFGNYPTFDILSSSEICSVKSHLDIDGGPKVPDYTNDFSNMLGWGRSFVNGLSPLAQDAQRITECAARGIPVPDNIINADIDQVVSFLQEKSIMRIPSDHVEAVRSALVEDAQQFSGNYYLTDNPAASHLQQLAERVQRTGLSGVETLEQLNDHKQQHGEKPSLDPSDNKAVGTQIVSTQEAIEKTVQETTDIIQENPLEHVKPEPSKNEDYDYGYGY